ncbi:helix-turn-helix domain-containing protein [Noviherbaspirillum galbum]|uniref:Helix-turn-helix domain-containing protein n=1 Tax=Noviherbaspirillum galbum TaxID=2709383 RepID=A0A6B3SJT0_9BURK|nr:helix-turn-helix domain-containing protein [Noviherbaspirillum galbum]NEX59615.1 helix-turn-helix domain-containing protein [Noviherbaspirillum galbum]
MKNHPLPGHDDPILTTSETARLLGVAVSTAQLWIESGTLDSWKTPGGHRRVRLSSVMRLLERQPSRSRADADPATLVSLPTEFLAADDPDYPVPENEAARLQALAATGLVDSPAEHAFDRLTWLAAQVTGASMALLSLLTTKRQWFKSRLGLDTAETPREWAFCSHAIVQDNALVVEDASRDPRFRDNPLVTGHPFIRFYAGFAVTDRNQLPLGTLCVLDNKPRALTEGQFQALHELSALASEEISRRPIALKTEK